MKLTRGRWNKIKKTQYQSKKRFFIKRDRDVITSTSTLRRRPQLLHRVSLKRKGGAGEEEVKEDTIPEKDSKANITVVTEAKGDADQQQQGEEELALMAGQKIHEQAVQAQAVEAQPVQAQAVQAQAVEAQPVQAQAVQAQAVQAQPVDGPHGQPIKGNAVEAHAVGKNGEPIKAFGVEALDKFGVHDTGKGQQHGKINMPDFFSKASDLWKQANDQNPGSTYSKEPIGNVYLDRDQSALKRDNSSKSTILPSNMFKAYVPPEEDEQKESVNITHEKNNSDHNTGVTDDKFLSMFQNYIEQIVINKVNAMTQHGLQNPTDAVQQNVSTILQEPPISQEGNNDENIKMNVDDPYA